MDKQNKLISASEINRYAYCHYQWYYERLYGKKYLRELYKQRNEKLGYKNSTKSNFKKGQEFHDTYLEKDQMRRAIQQAVLLALLVGSAIILYWLLK